MDIYFGPQFERGDDIMLRIEDMDSYETVTYDACEDCNGASGYDASTDCEVYDDWHDCQACEGFGTVELHHV